MIESAYLIPLFPLVGFLLLAAFGKRLGDPKAGWLGFAAVGLSFLSTLVVWLGLLTHQSAGGFRTRKVELFDWISVGTFNVDATLLVDPLSLTMCLFVTGVSALIHLYSIGYMKGDPRYHQFFAYLNLFVFSMVVLVLADNLLLLFLGWEGVGTCSYLLVGFWFERNTAASAAKKAFVVNRIGDVGLLLGMFVVFESLGTLTFYEDGAGFLERLGLLEEGTVTAIALLLFVGAVGKSAQLPLFTWLPDAMEGPTPVSALIHAATMVTAGVYLMVRIAPALEISHDAALVVAIVGAASALFAATIACAQNDIKRVLAYSTMSQLGYMFTAVGVGAYAFGMFHMVTHAFFKALLFMGAGAVIHALHDEQDLKRMGNLRKYMSVTFVCFAIGWLAISGVFPFAGFWSKDEILLSAYEDNLLLFIVLAFTAFLTAFYMSRLFFLAFFGKDRWKQRGKSTTKHEEPVAEHSAQGAGGKPHESPKVMLIPMVVLALFSVVGGLLNVSWGPFDRVLEHFLESVAGLAGHHEVLTGTKWLIALIGTGLSLAGIGAAYLVARKASPWPVALEPRVLARAWFVDPLYSAVIERPGHALARFTAYFVDNKVVDGAVNGSARLVGVTGGGLRRVQSGFVRGYALSIAAGSTLILVWVLIRSVA